MKESYHSEKFLSDVIFKSDVKKPWKTMKDLIGKAKENKWSLPQKIKVNKKDIFDQEKKVTEFNRFFTVAGPILAKKILESKNTFESYPVKTSVTMKHKLI